MKRRNFFVLGIAAMGGLLGWRVWHTSDQAAIVAVLRKRLGYLRLDEAGVQQFALDTARIHAIASSRLHLAMVAGPLYFNHEFQGRDFLSKAVRHGEERIVSNYLLSSDFFQHGADMSRTVLYLGLYDPLRGCGNPFARTV